MATKDIKSELKNDNRQKPEAEECFVIMPISDQPGYDAGHFRKVYEDIFTPACIAAGYNATRADGVKESNLIHLDILKRVVQTPMAICDLSGRNPNVLFELGLRQAFDMPTILVKDVETPEIFDIAPIRYTTYHRTLSYREVLTDQSAVADALKATKDAVGKTHNVNSLIRLLELSAPAKIERAGVVDPQDYFQILMAEIGNLKREIRNNAPRAELVSANESFSSPKGRAASLDKLISQIEHMLKRGIKVEKLQTLIKEAKEFGESSAHFYSRFNDSVNLSSTLDSLARLDALIMLDQM